MSDPVVIRGQGQTIGVQTVVLAAFTPPVNSAGIVEMLVVGLSVDNLAGGATRKAMVKKIAGVLTNIGDFEATVLKGDAGLAGVTIQPAFNNGAIELQVTGVAGKTINWTGSFTVNIHVTP